MPDLKTMPPIPNAATATFKELNTLFEQLKEGTRITQLQTILHWNLLEYGGVISVVMDDKIESDLKYVSGCKIFRVGTDGNQEPYCYAFFSNGEVEIRTDFFSSSTIKTLPSWEEGIGSLLREIESLFKSISSASDLCRERIDLLLEQNKEPPPTT